MAGRSSIGRGIRYLVSRKKLLWEVFLLSVILHLVFVLVAGGIVVFRNVFANDAQFEGEKLARTVDPRLVEYRVQVQDQQQKSGRPVPTQRITAAKVSDFSLPDMPVEPKRRAAPVQFAPEDFNLAGEGLGLGSGRGSGGLGLGESKVSFFGITASGERIFFMVDVSESMAEDHRGGYAGYELLKQEVAGMVAALEPTTFFNIAVFAEGVHVMEDEMKRATDDQKAKAKPFLDGFLVHNGNRYRTNATGGLKPPEFYRVGSLCELVYTDTTERKVTPAKLEWEYRPAGGGRTRTDLAVLASLMQGADTVFIISDGNPHIWKTLEGTQLERLNKRRMQWFRSLARDGFKGFNADKAAEKLLEEKENAKRAEKGLAPRAQELRGGGPFLPAMTSRELVDALLDAQKTIRETQTKDSGQAPKPTRIFTVGYASSRDEQEFLKLLSRRFGGRHRPAKSIAPPVR
jgi:hypothetical protein